MFTLKFFEGPRPRLVQAVVDPSACKNLKRQHSLKFRMNIGLFVECDQ